LYASTTSSGIGPGFVGKLNASSLMSMRFSEGSSASPLETSEAFGRVRRSSSIDSNEFNGM